MKQSVIRAASYLVVVLLVVLAPNCRSAVHGGNMAVRQAADERLVVLDARGVKRYSLLHMPVCRQAETAVPLVIMLHGGGQNGRLGRYISNFNRVADQYGFAVLYPDGSGRFGRFLLTWNADGCCGYSKSRKIDDAGFIEKLIDELTAGGRIDSARVYLAGFSNGAMLAYKIACEKSSKIAAILAVGGSMSGREPQPENPLSVMIVHGSKDAHVPFEGGVGKMSRLGYPVNEQSVEYAKSFWIKHNDCSAYNVEHSGPVKIEAFSEGIGGSQVRLCTIKGGKHAWPGGRRVFLYNDKPYRNFDVSKESWLFFSGQRLRSHAAVASQRTTRVQTSMSNTAAVAASFLLEKETTNDD